MDVIFDILQILSRDPAAGKERATPKAFGVEILPLDLVRRQVPLTLKLAWSQSRQI